MYTLIIDTVMLYILSKAGQWSRKVSLKDFKSFKTSWAWWVMATDLEVILPLVYVVDYWQYSVIQFHRDAMTQMGPKASPVDFRMAPQLSTTKRGR